MHVLITAGPTREPIDAVRFISNRSSGRTGMMLAEAAAQAGHQVTLLLGPVIAPPRLRERCVVHRFTTCEDLQRLLAEHFPTADVLIMAAAVADFRPRRVQTGKLAREQDAGGGASPPMLELQPTPDLVAAAAGGERRPSQKIVAFALEEEDHLETRAMSKMRRKGVDAVVANPLTTMESPRISPMLLTAGGGRETPGAMSKSAFARWLIARVERL